MGTEHFRIDERFQGPPKSGNGGYVCGRIAAPLGGTALVRLKAPPPLDTPLRLESSGDDARLYDGETLIGEARRAQLELPVGPCPDPAAAEAGSAAYTGFTSHVFPRCFVCGPQRSVADGLRIFPGPVAQTSLLAAPWTPDATLGDDDGSVRPEFLWAALDCPGGFTILPLPEGTAIVLGELCASVTGRVRVGERCVVTAWPLERQGRKRVAGSAVYDARGELVAKARAVWIEVPSSAWNAS